MELIPVRTMGHEEEAGKVTVLVPKFPGRFYQVMFPRTRYLYFKIRLDVIGSLAWNVMDGDRNVQQIADHIRKNSELAESQLSELEDRLNKYVTMLYERRYITFRQIMDK